MKTVYRFLIPIVAGFAFSCSSSQPAAQTEPPTADSQTAEASEMPADAVSGAATIVADSLPILGTDWTVDDAVPFDPAIIRDTLDNGIIIYVARNERPENRAELRLAVNAGSVLEDDDQLGLAHFVEHMAFNGTENFEKQEIVDYLERHGMSFGADLNAYTSFDETVYMLQVPTDSIDVLHTGFRILRDWASGVAFEDEEVEKERGVVVEEWRLRRGASARILDQQLPVLLKGSRYADRLPIGTPDIIRNADRDTITRFYSDWYRSDLMAVVAVGDFDPDSVAAFIRKTFGDLQPSEAPRQRMVFGVPGHEETLVATATDPEAPWGQVSVVYKREKEPTGKIADYRRGLAAGLYHAMFNSRLGELTQTSDPPFAFAGSGSGAFAREAEFYQLSALVREGGAERALATLLAEAERVRLHGFLESELNREKESLLRYFERAYAERDKSESNRYASEYLRNFLDDEPVPGIEFEYPLVESLLPTISIEEVNDLSRKLITDDSRVVMLSGPEDLAETLPDSTEVIALFAAADAASPEPYVDRTLDEPLVGELPPPGSIIDETTIDTLGMTWLTLSNGVRVVLKPTDFKNDEIQFRAYSEGGTSLYPDSIYIAASTAATVIAQSGLGNFGPIEFDKAMSGKVASVSPSIGESAENLSGFASPKDLETLFQLIYLNFTAPRADQTAFDSYRVRMRELIESAKVTPERAFFDTVRVTMAQHHFRARPATEAMLDEMNLQTSYEIFRDRFADASDFTFYFVGSFTDEAIRPLIEQYLAVLPALDREESPMDVGMRPPTGLVERTVERGLEPKSRVQLIFTGPLEFTHENRMRIQTFSQILRIKLREVLREDLGGTYGVSVGASTSSFPEESYNFNISFGCDPDRVDELYDRLLVQIDSLHEFGIGEPYLEKAREIRRRDHEEQLKSNRYWLGSIAFVDRHDEDPMTILEGYTEFMTRLDQDMMRDAARDFLRLDHYAKFVLLPEATPDAEPVMDGADSESGSEPR